MCKKLLAVLLTAAMCMSTVAVVSAEDETGTEDEIISETGDLSGKTFGLVVRESGNPYAEKEADGFKEVIEDAGAECIVLYPEDATADAQIPLIQSLITQDVDAIAIASNDENALSAALQEALDDGIKVLSLDSNVEPSSRMIFVNQAGVMEIGETLMDAIYDVSGGEGQYAILSATSQSANQNSWIDAMAEVAASDEKYADLELVEVAYGDDELQKSTDQTYALLSNYPDLKVICAPTTVGIAAAAKVLQDEGSDVILTGLGLPSEMAEYIGDDDEHSCPYMFLWNPSDLGALAAYTAIALVEGEITGAVGETYEAGDLEASPYTITECDDGGTEVILGVPFRFDPDNIDEWKDIY